MKKKRNNLKYKPLLILGLIILFVVIISIFNFYVKNKKDLEKASLASSFSIPYPTLYSDKHITENAIKSHPKFKNLVTFKRETLTANVSSSIKKNKTYISSGRPDENGTWLWTPLLDITPSYRTSIINGAKKHNIKNIYLSIDSYLDIYIMEEGEEKESKKKLFDEALEDFIIEANKANITVDAEGGWRNWAEPGNLYKPFAVLDYAINYNATHKNKLRGFQYDVEPYLLDNYPKNKKVVLRNFINLIDESVLRLENSDLELTVVIPEFYDGANNETPTFFYGGRLGYAFDHLLSILDNRMGSKIIIMSYRNFSKGENGAIEISKDEINAANKYETKVILSLETGDVLPQYVTFYKTPRNYYNRERKTLEQAFEREKSYHGMAVHYINAFMELK